MCRGNRREPIFWDDRDRYTFLETMGEACERTGWIVHSYVLMTNHYHWLLETPEANLCAGMQWFQATYAQRFSVRHHLVGHVFQGRYKSPLIQNDGGDYFRTVSDYIHLNPARAGLLDKTHPSLASYPWSSFAQFIGPPARRPAWLEFERVASNLGLEEDTRTTRRWFGAYLEERARECLSGQMGQPEAQAWQHLRRGWYFGSDEFRDQLLERLESVLAGKKKSSFGGRVIRAHDEKQARELLTRALELLGLTHGQLGVLKKADLRKQALGWLIQTQTTMKQSWICEHLCLGSRTSLYKASRRFDESQPDQEVDRIKTLLANLTN